MSYLKSQLTPAKKKFAQAFAKSDNATQAVQEAYPEVSSREVAAVKGHRLLRNANVNEEVALQKHKMELIAAKAVKRLEEIVEHGKEHNALLASTYAYDHVHGKATQRIESSSKSVSINIDLSTSTPDTEQDTTDGTPDPTPHPTAG